MLLGLDISTSITGATVLDEEGNIVYCEAWDTRNKNKFPSIFDKVVFIKNKLWELDDRFGIDDVFIEQSLSRFRPGFSSAKTILTLSKFNGIVSWLCFEIYQKEPQYLGVTPARKACGITVPRGENAKEIVLKFLLDNEPKFDIMYTKYGNPKPESYDRADSIVIARAGYNCIKKNSKS